jgi:glucose-1-phosphate thymidylyltransferase
MRGILLAGGSGSRLSPITLAISKQLVPIYDKPMVYYPLSTLILAGVTEVLVITTPHDQDQFRRLLGDGSQFGITIEYAVQPRPEGLAQAILIGEHFISGQPFILILGDNILHGAGMGEALQLIDPADGATIFAQTVKDPERYGVVEFDDAGRALNIEEKPSKPKSLFAIPGLYFYDSSAVEKVRTLRPSQRGELEISDLNSKYLLEGRLQVKKLPRGTVWFDTGTIDSLVEAMEYVRVVENRQAINIGSPEEVAWRLGLISTTKLKSQANKMGSSTYGQYLLGLDNCRQINIFPKLRSRVWDSRG